MKLEFFLVFMLYFVLGTVVALISRRFFARELNDYYIAGKRLSAVVSAGTYAATTYSAFMMVGLVGLAYSTGIGALGFELAYLAATLILLSTIGYKIWSLSRRKEWISPAQMLGDLYSSRLLATIITAVYLFAMIPYISAQVLGLKLIFSYGGLGKVEALILSLITIYAWIFIAGMWSVAYTDLYQAIIMLFSAIAYIVWLAIFTSSKGAGFVDVLNILVKSGLLGLTGFWNSHTFIAYTLPWVFFAITNPQVVVRLYLPRDSKAYRKMVMYFFIYGYLYTVIAVFVGLVAAGLASLGLLPKIGIRDMVTPYLLTLMHPLLGSIIAVSIIAAAVSTANSIVLAVSGSVLSCITPRGKLLLARIVDLSLVVAAGIVAFLEPGFIVELSVLTSVILLPLVPLTVLAVYGSQYIGSFTRTLAPISITAGVLTAVVPSVVLGPTRTFREVILGMPISAHVLLTSTVVLVAGLLLDFVKHKSTPVAR